MTTLTKYFFCLLLALSLAATAPALAQDVGEVVLARNTVRAEPAGGSLRPLAVGDAITLGLPVSTGADSAVKMTFDPRGALTLGANTRLVVNRFVVDRATGRNESALSVLAGTVRLALGKLFSGEVAIDTPTAVVGVKGTDLRVEVGPDGTTIVSVTEGAVTVQGKAGGQVAVSAGFRTVVAPGQGPTPPSAIDLRGETLSAAAGGPAFTTPQSTFPESPLLDAGVRFLPPSGQDSRQ